MKLDREYQKKILDCLARAFPNIPSPIEYDTILGAENDDVFVANALYLEMHGLIQPGGIRISPDRSFMIDHDALKITHRGLDFLADDGGLSAILGVVTIKLHEDTLKELVAMKIQQSDLPPADKSIWLDALKKLPAEATKHLAVKLMDAGLAHAPDALRQVGSMLGLH